MNRFQKINQLYEIIVQSEEETPEVPTEEAPESPEETPEAPAQPVPFYPGAKLPDVQPTGVQPERGGVYEGRIPVKVCPKCGYYNSIHNTECTNCKRLYSKLLRGRKGYNLSKPDHRFRFFRDFARKLKKELSIRGSSVTLLSPEVLEDIFETKGITPLDASNVEEAEPTKALKQQLMLDRLNSRRDEGGDIVIDEKTGLPVALESKNFFTLAEILKMLSEPDAVPSNATKEEIDELNATIGLEEFYQAIEEYNNSAPEDKQVTPVDTSGQGLFGKTDPNAPEKLEVPEFQGGTERARIEPEQVATSKMPGYGTIWAWNDYLSPISKRPRVGVATVFADRLEYLNEKLRPMAARNRIDNKIRSAKEAITRADSAIEMFTNDMKENKNLKKLHFLREKYGEEYQSTISTIRSQRGKISNLKNEKERLLTAPASKKERSRNEVEAQIVEEQIGEANKELRKMQEAFKANRPLMVLHSLEKRYGEDYKALGEARAKAKLSKEKAEQYLAKLEEQKEKLEERQAIEGEEPSSPPGDMGMFENAPRSTIESSRFDRIRKLADLV